MTQTKKVAKNSKQPKQTNQDVQNEEVLKLLANFLKKSTVIMETAIKETREKHPNLFKSS